MDLQAPHIGMSEGEKRVLRLDMASQGLESEAVALRSEPGDHADSDRGDKGMVPKRFTCKDVREMNLDDGQRNRRQGIA